MSINEDNGNMRLTDIFKRTYCPQTTGVLEATIKGTPSSFMKSPKTKINTRRTQKGQEHSKLIPRIFREL